MTTMAEAGIPVDKDADDRAFLAAMTAHRLLKGAGTDLGALRTALTAEGLGHLAQMGDDRLGSAVWSHQQIAVVLSAVKFGIGKLRERLQGLAYKWGSRGRGWSGRPRARTSGQRPSPRRGRTCTARWRTWRRAVTCSA
ncbi:hypothetical protein [Kitasatospora sp. NPDC058046]|uniref:hypothetical protein n=1 Tax=Kitasatospora sp. NPDC058046 TaxID=3346312 RepID=UPI0036DA18D6